MKTRPLLTAIGIVLLGLLCPHSLRAQQPYSIALTNTANGLNSVVVAPGGTFQVTLTLNATASSIGIDYFLQILNGGSSQFQITGRDLSGSTFNQPITADSIALQPGRALLDPRNDDDLGAGLADPNSPNGAGSFLVANLTLQALAGAAPGSYTLSTFGATVGDAGFNDNPVTDATINVTVVPEPAITAFLLVGGLLGLGLYRRNRRSLAALALLFLVFASVSQAQTTITQWNFNSIVNDTNVGTGTTAPSVGVGSLSLIGGTTSTFATGSPSDPNTTDNSGFNTSTYPGLNTASGTAGVQFNISTAGSTGPIQLTLDFRQSATASRYFQLLVSADGINFTAPSGGTAFVLGPIPSPNTATSFSDTGLYSNNSGSGSQQFVQGIQYNFANGSVYENNPNFAFRWVSVFDPSNGTGYTASNTGSTYSTAGTARFDLVTLAAVPEPSFYILLGIGGLLCAQRFVRRRRYSL